MKYLGKRHDFAKGLLNDNTKLLAWATKNIKTWPDKTKLLVSCTAFAEGIGELALFPSIKWTKFLAYEPSFGAFFHHTNDEYVSDTYISDSPQAISYYEWLSNKEILV